MTNRLTLTLTCLLALSFTTEAAEIYVSPKGDDANPGTEEKPLRTLDGARNSIRALRKTSGLPAGGVTVFLRGGVYTRTSTFTLSKEDSGTAESPIWKLVNTQQGSERLCVPKRNLA